MRLLLLMMAVSVAAKSTSITFTTTTAAAVLLAVVVDDFNVMAVAVWIILCNVMCAAKRGLTRRDSGSAGCPCRKSRRFTQPR